MSPDGTLDLSVLPSSELGGVARIDLELDGNTAFVAFAERAGEELIVARTVGGGAREEIVALELHVPIVDGPGVEV